MMKALKILLVIIGLGFAGSINAQVSVNINVGSPPMWGPSGYSDVQYYYIPDVYAYYDVPSANFIYYEGGTWVHRTYLPRKYRNYDLYNGYKVVLTDYRGATPYVHYKQHKVKYHKGYRGPSQKNIGNKPGNGNGNSKARMNSSGSKKKGPARSYNTSGQSHNKQGNASRGSHGKKGNGGGKGKK